ncbi:MAG TPA: hypothetical protein VML55_20160 [Planctomycetaceae bacterium]|nr:hypothetical protein [Planctomycetaceae bacterium]
MTRHSVRSAAAVGLTLIVVGSFAAAPPDSPKRAADGQAAPREEGPTVPQQPAEKTDLQKFMRAKLAAADLILEGLVTEKFTLVRKGAEQLRQTSESDQWRASNDALYRQYSREFQRKIQQLDQSAQDKNLDRAALAWVDTTLSCVECHKWVNAILIAERPRQPGGGPRNEPVPELEALFARHRSSGFDTILVADTAAPNDVADGPNAPGNRRQPAEPEPAGDEPDAEQRVSRFMREKLASAQQVLEGVLVEDFELVTKGARRMALMSQAAEWHVFDTPAYREDSAEFRAKCRQLIKAADDERTDAAALNYLQLTLSCIRCHQHVRANRVADSGGRPSAPALSGLRTGLARSR